MSTDLVIARLGSALAALGEARTIQETKAVLDVATAAQIYARRQKLSEENIAFANEVKFEAMRQLGELLKAAPKNTGEKGRFTGGSKSEPPAPPTLADQGIDKKTSMTAQRLADLPPEKFQAVKAGEMTLAKATAKPVAKGTAPKPAKKEVAPEPENPHAAEEALQGDIEAATFKAEFAIFYADDENKHMVDQIRQLTAEVVTLRSRVTGLMNELVVARQSAKSWKAKAEKAEKAAKESAF